MEPILQITDLHAGIEEREILKGINLTVRAGEVHAIMGLNGSGKSTLAGVLSGRDAYNITKGEVFFKGQELLELDPEERAREGLFLAFQYPVEIPGVNTQVFLRAAVNAVRAHKGEEELSPVEFLKLVNQKLGIVQMNKELLKRAVNEGFSGGEKKRAEIFQMAMLEPKLAILDETDSGLDIDALRIVSDGVNALKRDDNAFVVITHYQRLLNYIVPDFVHILHDGRIIHSGGKELALMLESEGYEKTLANLRISTEKSAVDAESRAQLEEADSVADAIAHTDSAFVPSPQEASLATQDNAIHDPEIGDMQAESEAAHASRLEAPEPVPSL